MATPGELGPDAMTHLKESNRERDMILQDQLVTPGGGNAKFVNQIVENKASDIEENILNNLL